MNKTFFFFFFSLPKKRRFVGVDTAQTPQTRCCRRRTNSFFVGAFVSKESFAFFFNFLSSPFASVQNPKRIVWRNLFFFEGLLTCVKKSAFEDFFFAKKREREHLIVIIISSQSIIITRFLFWLRDKSVCWHTHAEEEEEEHKTDKDLTTFW